MDPEGPVRGDNSSPSSSSIDLPLTSSNSLTGSSTVMSSEQTLLSENDSHSVSEIMSHRKLSPSSQTQESSSSPCESSIRMYVASQDGTLTDDDSGENLTQVKVNRGTVTERGDSKPQECKYCMLRLSMLRKLEKRKSHKGSEDLSFNQKPHSTQPAKKDKGCQTSASLFERAEMTQRELRSLAMILRFREGKPLRTETFCKCVRHGRERDCRCGEEEKYFDWVWDTKERGMATSLQERGRLVVFHKDYSCGTTAIRGQQPMEKDQHFWEIKMTTPVYGTDMMVGVGTPNVELNKFHNTFCSMIGSDLDSWGISYDGRVHHNGRKKEYCGRFGQGAIIGVHLDMWRGTLTFFKNRQCLGVAFRGLRGRTLYPMACSTAARSAMRVISSRSFPTSLQFLCCQTLRHFVPAHLSVLDALSMPPGLRAFLANNMTWLLHVPHMGIQRPKTGYICHICMPLKSVFEGYTDDEDEDTDEDQVDHVHDAFGAYNVETSDEETAEDDMEDISDKPRSLFGSNGYPLKPSMVRWRASSASPLPLVTTTASTSEHRSVVVTQRTLSGFKKSRLDVSETEIGIEEEDSSEDGGESETLGDEKDVPSTSSKLGKRRRSQ